MTRFWAELRPRLRNKLSEFEVMIVAPNTDEVIEQIEIHFPGSTRRRRLADGAEVFVLRSNAAIRVFLRHRQANNAALLRLFLPYAEVHDNPNAGAVIVVEVPMRVSEKEPA